MQKPLHSLIGVQLEPEEQEALPPMVQPGSGVMVVVRVSGGVERMGVDCVGVDPVIGVTRQTPVHTSVGVQKALVGHEEDGPTSQGIVGRLELLGGGWLVAMHCPPQGAVLLAVQYSVGVHVEPVGQGPLLPIVQGMTGGKIWEVRQSPPHDEVGVQLWVG